jgi:hypothetical protein
MTYKHKRTTGLTCQLVTTEKRGKQVVYVATIGDMIFRANKEVFYQDWVETKN